MTTDPIANLRKNLESAVADINRAFKKIQAEPVTVYPRLLGEDKYGDLVWELDNGLWTSGPDPRTVLNQKNRWSPQAYLDLYGDLSPVARTFTGEMFARKMDRVVTDWMHGAKENHEALSHHDEDPPCWTRFEIVDIKAMVREAILDMNSGS